ncbi:MAG: hypothetical protein F6K53_37775, partial [Moorea sp. SIO4A1]|uniref:hypothetical protein n=1 Tax=Moorena sp. SIO4A1 TaxID=2607835 RepID=UPI00144B8747
MSVNQPNTSWVRRVAIDAVAPVVAAWDLGKGANLAYTEYGAKNQLTFNQLTFNQLTFNQLTFN